MAVGDEAADAGMDVVAPIADIRLAYMEINRTRDYLAALILSLPDFSTGHEAPGAAAVRDLYGFLHGGDPTFELHYANKRYVDGQVAAINARMTAGGI